MEHTFSHQALRDGTKTGNNFFLAVIAGVMAALVGTLIWALIALYSGPQSDYLALGMALLVGISIRFGGQGTGIVYGLLGAMLTLLGSMAGSIVAVIESGTTDLLDFWGVLAHLNLVEVVMSIISQATSMTYIFAGVSAVIAFTLSIRPAEHV